MELLLPIPDRQVDAMEDDLRSDWLPEAAITRWFSSFSSVATSMSNKDGVPIQHSSWFPSEKANGMSSKHDLFEQIIVQVSILGCDTGTCRRTQACLSESVTDA